MGCETRVRAKTRIKVKHNKQNYLIKMTENQSQSQLEQLPRDLLGEIISRVAPTSRTAVRNVMAASPKLALGAQDEPCGMQKQQLCATAETWKTGANTATTTNKW
ncbi:unnamed protein product [Thlaspi arvense]|uniref:F-box domain-containing protein n=1 Tax=Thlaspi arvense TaxID=13288 RepID=A0AAU9SG23_THLAR|nr:unnamed protein product [Thlaspi arvense]